MFILGQTHLHHARWCVKNNLSHLTWLDSPQELPDPKVTPLSKTNQHQQASFLV